MRFLKDQFAEYTYKVHNYIKTETQNLYRVKLVFSWNICSLGVEKLCCSVSLLSFSKIARMAGYHVPFIIGNTAFTLKRTNSLSKKSRHRSNATERGVWSGSTLFATHKAAVDKSRENNDLNFRKICLGG